MKRGLDSWNKNPKVHFTSNVLSGTALCRPLDALSNVGEPLITAAGLHGPAIPRSVMRRRFAGHIASDKRGTAAHNNEKIGTHVELYNYTMTELEGLRIRQHAGSKLDRRIRYVTEKRRRRYFAMYASAHTLKSS
ncbi:hypothetical protein FKM82_003716 [Ascaphus truei]